jgi:hypothetical protein
MPVAETVNPVVQAAELITVMAVQVVVQLEEKTGLMEVQALLF